MSSTWTFLTNHAHVLLCLAGNPDATLREVAEQVLRHHPRCRVLYMSGYAADVIGDRETGIEDASFLEKPFGSDQLLARVRDVLDASEAASAPARAT